MPQGRQRICTYERFRITENPIKFIVFYIVSLFFISKLVYACLVYLTKCIKAKWKIESMFLNNQMNRWIKFYLTINSNELNQKSQSIRLTITKDWKIFLWSLNGPDSQPHNSPDIRYLAKQLSILSLIMIVVLWHIRFVRIRYFNWGLQNWIKHINHVTIYFYSLEDLKTIFASVKRHLSLGV